MLYFTTPNPSLVFAYFSVYMQKHCGLTPNSPMLNLHQTDNVEAHLVVHAILSLRPEECRSNLQ